MSNEKIYYTKPHISELEVQYATDAARNGWGERCYEYIGRFEDAFKQHLGVKYAIATSSCTGALHMGLAGIGIGPGDEVILADTNWVASAAPIVYLGANPVFVDIRADTWCLDPSKVRQAITLKTKAILAVHLYGNLCEMDELLSIAEQYGVPVMEDAAEAIGSIYHGRPAGSIGRFGAFSFHGSKTITTGEGGMFVTNDPDLYETVLTLSNHGRSPTQKRQFWPDVIGFKYKMSNLQAAIGFAQMQQVDALIERKRSILRYYRAQLGIHPGIAINPEPEGITLGAWMPTVVFDRQTGVTVDRLQKEFAADNIDARVFFSPLSSLPAFKPKPENRNAWDIPSHAINLPSYHDMTRGAQDRVIAVIRRCLPE